MREHSDTTCAVTPQTEMPTPNLAPEKIKNSEEKRTLTDPLQNRSTEHTSSDRPLLRGTMLAALLPAAAVLGSCVVAGAEFLASRDLLFFGMIVSAAAGVVALVKMAIAANPGRRLDRLKVWAEGGAIAVAVLAMVFFITREMRTGNDKAEDEQIEATQRLYTSQNMRELVRRLCELERRAGVTLEAQASNRLVCPPR